ncbi:MAG: hypothetical protein R2809_15020 [Flavobacteriales bacterium]
MPVTQNINVQMIPAPLVNAGNDQVVCVTNLDVALSGSVSGSSNNGVWSTSGSGTFAPSNTSLNAVYTCSAADSLAGGVTLTLTSVSTNTCLEVSDQMTISVLPAGTANAGNDVEVCGNNPNISLSGNIGGGASSGVWSSNGTGTFSPNANTLNATYVPSAADIALGTVTLTLTANSCNAASDQITVTISPSRTIDVGEDMVVCADVTEVDLSVLVNNGPPEIIWTTTGSGTITPSINDLDITYLVDNDDIINETISFTATTINNGSCLPVSDVVLVHFYPTGTANAGIDQTLCSNNALAQLNSTITGGASLGEWTTLGTGIFTPSSTTLNAIYNPSEQDLVNGSVLLTLTATNSCNQAQDEITINFFAAPEISAGEDQSFCGESPSFQLNASANNANGVVWTGGNGTFIPNSTSLNPTYIPSATEQSFGSVTLTLSSTGNAGCSDVSDAVTLYMSSGLTVNVGEDIVVCNAAEFVQLNGNITNGSPQGIWTTNGTGTFSPSETNLNVQYALSDVDYEMNEIQFILTTTANGNCPINSDTLYVSFARTSLLFCRQRYLCMCIEQCG